MNFNQAFPGNWLKSSDLGDDDCLVTIKDARMEHIGQGNDAQDKLVLEFEEFPKPMVCNLTNAKTIAKLHGEDTDSWIGQQVTLWVNHDVQFGSETVSAIRVRNKAPGKRATTASNGLLSYKQAVELCASRGVAEQDMKDFLKRQGFTGWNSQTCTPLVRQLAAGLEPPAGADPHIDNDDIPFAHCSPLGNGLGLPLPGFRRTI